MAVRIESQAEPIPGYKLVERLGGGGFGEVWKAIAPGGLPKAIKFVYGDLQAANDDGVRAEQELKALSRVKTVRHPYILSLERYDIIDGQLLIVMELADRNLWDRFKECRAQGLPGIPRDELLRYVEETSEALDLMNNDYQLQHLDIKPQNLFLVHNHAKVADFGLVKDLQGMMASVTGGITPVYAAPETFDGWISRFCDQYSLAIVYQELLTGQRPFNGTNVGQLIMQHMKAAPNLASLPAGDREAIGRALSKNPDDRFPKCQDLVRALWGSQGMESVAARAAAHDSGLSRLTPPRALEETPPRSGAGRDDDCTTPPKPQSAAHSSGTVPLTENARWIRVRELAARKPEEKPAPPEPAHELQKDGVLFPALVIGLGSTGLAVLQHLRQNLQENFGSCDALPTIRLLYLDTDPEAMRSAAQGHPAALTSGEVLQIKLNRPSHYVRPHSGRPPIDSWFDLKLLYRIPRNPMTAGLRVLGRLAFFDNYRAVTTRLGKEVEACTSPEALARVAEQPGLGLRSLRPRVYVVTSLAGGTGSGMFLDLAYVLRRILKGHGYDCPEVVGLFLLPAVDRSPGQTLALANAFAALTELNHFSAPETRFTAHFDDKEPPIDDAEPPFNRCVLLPLPAANDGGKLHDLAGLTADFLCRDLTTPLGRAADECRAGMIHPTGKSWSLACQSFGMYRISWPRYTFLRHVARHHCQLLVAQWLSKDAAPVRDAIKAAVAEQWPRFEVDGEHLLARLQTACEQALRQTPEEAFAAAAEPLAQLEAHGADVTPVAQVLEQLEQLVGRPGETVGTHTGALAEPLNTAAEALSAVLGRKLGKFVTGFIEQSGSRLAGAEEAVRQVIALIEQDLQNHETLGKELAARVENVHARIGPLLASLQASTPKNRRAVAAVGNLVELVRSYPTWRLQSLMLQRVVTIYVSLRGHLSDQLREINYCRARLAELLNSFQEPLQQTSAEESLPWGCLLFPAGCRSLRDAVQQMLETVTPEELGELDGLMENLLREQFQGLVHVCLTSANLLANLEAAMEREAEAFAGARLAGTSVAEMYLAHHASEEEARDDLDAVFEAAAPALTGGRSSAKGEICILAAPPGPVGERFRDLARGALPDVELVAAGSTDDIIFYREVPHLMLADLEQLGPLGYEAYRQIVTQKHFTPHSRTDINEWRAAGA